MKTPHLFNEEKRRAGLPIGSFAMQSVPDQQPAAGQAALPPYDLVSNLSGNGEWSHFIQSREGDPNDPDTIAAIRYCNDSAETAAFIVRACNENAQLHELVNANVIARCDAQDRADKLAAVLEELVNAVAGMGYDTVPVIQESHAKARAALQSAKE